MGIDLYCFSGGKGLCGPQCSGLLMGRKDLIEAALMNYSPREGAVCRPMKVGKEEIIGCLTALESWLRLDEKKLYTEWNGRVDRIRKLVETIPGAKTNIYIPDDGNRYPTFESFLGRAGLGLHCDGLCARAARGQSQGGGARTRQSESSEGSPRRELEPERSESPGYIELISMTSEAGAIK